MNSDENILAKVEIAYYEQFLLLSQYFQKSTAADVPKKVFVNLILDTDRILTPQQLTTFKNIGETTSIVKMCNYSITHNFVNSILLYF